MPTLECEICLEGYDPIHHKPLFGTCGHTFCSTCISRFERRQCPLCREGGTFGSPKPNFAILKLLEEEQPIRDQGEYSSEMQLKDQKHVAIDIETASHSEDSVTFRNFDAAQWVPEKYPRPTEFPSFERMAMLVQSFRVPQEPSRMEYSNLAAARTQQTPHNRPLVPQQPQSERSSTRRQPRTRQSECCVNLKKNCCSRENQDNLLYGCWFCFLCCFLLSLYVLLVVLLK